MFDNKMSKLIRFMLFSETSSRGSTSGRSTKSLNTSRVLLCENKSVKPTGCDLGVVRSYGAQLLSGSPGAGSHNRRTEPTSDLSHELSATQP